MATSKSYRDFVIEQLGDLEGFVCRPMRGEYLLYCKNKLFGGIYDERVLLKKTKSNEKYGLEERIPYKGAKAMYFLENIEDKEQAYQMIWDTWEDLPFKK